MADPACQSREPSHRLGWGAAPRSGLPLTGPATLQSGEANGPACHSRFVSPHFLLSRPRQGRGVGSGTIRPQPSSPTNQIQNPYMRQIDK